MLAVPLAVITFGILARRRLRTALSQLPGRSLFSLCAYGGLAALCRCASIGAARASVWRTLIEAKRELPSLTTVALAQAPTIYPGTPWTGGVPIDADAWNGSLARAVQSIGAKVLSPRFQDLTDPLIAAAKQQGLLDVPWTVDDAPTMSSLIDRGVDGIISDDVDLLLRVAKRNGLA
jgi:hypothetical protein